MKRDDTIEPIGEELFDQFIGWLDGPLNETMERVVKNKVVLAACGITLTTSCKMLSRLQTTPLAPFLPTTLWNRLQ